MQINKFDEMLEEIHRERGVSKEALVEAIKASLLSAVKKNIKEETGNLEVKISPAGDFRIIHQELNAQGEVVTEQDITPRDFGRLAAQTAKQVIIQRIREAEKDEAFDEFEKKQGTLVTGVVQRREYGGYLINLGRLETVLSVAEQIPGEVLRERDRVKLYVVEVRKTPKGPFVVVSRAHIGLVTRLFELEVPELKDGTLEIKAIAREAGRRTKLAVLSHDKNIGAVGTCVGHMGARIQNVIRELGQERVDIIEWKKEPAAFIINAMNPAKVVKVELVEKGTEKNARVYVPAKDLALAIGKEGQNVRLAVKLTGWKLDVVSEAELTAGKGEQKAKKVEKFKEAKAVEKKKVSALAKELGLSNKEVIDKLNKLGLVVKTAASLVPKEAVEKLKHERKD